MNHFLKAALPFFFWSAAFADDIPQVQIHDQQGAQQRCIQQFINDCLGKCDESDLSHCATLCQEQAANQCRDAGE